jgi:hypothetical protein
VPGGLLGPMLIIAAGLGLLFVPMSLVSLTKVRNQDTGVASSLLNVGQQVGGSIGLRSSAPSRGARWRPACGPRPPRRPQPPRPTVTR